MLIALATKKHWIMHQLDVKSAFLNGDLKEEVYLEQPEGFVQKGKEHLVCKLKKALYGLKQAPRSWYEKIDSFFLQFGYNRSDATYLIDEIKEQMSQMFEMKHLGELRYYLGLEIWRDLGQTFLSQAKYVKGLLEKFRMDQCKPAPVPLQQNIKLQCEYGSKAADATLCRQLVGSLIYLTTTRPDLTYVVIVLSQFMSKPLEGHWNAMKIVLRYLQGIVDYNIIYTDSSDVRLAGFADLDWERNVDDRRSITGYAFSLGSTVITWSSKKQNTISLSSAEAEYQAMCAATCQAVWLRRLLQDVREELTVTTTIRCDNQSSIKLANNPMFHKNTKHIDTQFHFVSEKVQSKEIHLEYCNTCDNVVDIFTKPLGKFKFQMFREMLGIYVNPFSIKGEC
eukprot:PITA_02005